MKPIQTRLFASITFAALLWLAAPLPVAGALVAFGLTNTPIGGANITFPNGVLTVTPSGGSYADAPGVASSPSGHYGVSVQLGDADSGIFVYPYHNGYVNDGNFLVGEVFGVVDGLGEQPICSLRARREREGNHTNYVNWLVEVKRRG